MFLLCNLRNLRNIVEVKEQERKLVEFCSSPNIFITCNNHRFNDYCNRKIFSKLFLVVGFWCYRKSKTYSNQPHKQKEKLIQFLFGNKLKNKSNFHKKGEKTFPFFLPTRFLSFSTTKRKRKAENSLKPTRFSFSVDDFPI